MAVTKSHDAVWCDASNVLKGMLNPELFSRWFASIRAVEISEGSLHLGVANEFYQIWLQDNFLSLIRDAVNQVSRHPLQVKFVVRPEAGKPCEPPLSLPSAAVKLSAASSRPPFDIKLNPRYMFQSFVIGPNNEHAHATALAVAQSPGKAYNPLFIYGGVGLGKTHLLQAIGHAVAAGRHHLKVNYVTCEQFTNDFIQSLQTNSVPKFRKKYRGVDLLLIDDVQFLAGKERMQEEFFHTFNSLYDSHKQIVLSADRPATEIANLELRLVSRFEWGLAVDLHPPTFETRLAILRNKAASLNIHLPDLAIQFIAERIKTNIRRLEGALLRVASYSSLSQSEISLDNLESLLRDSLAEEARHSITIEAIQKKVAEHFDLRLADMTSHRRPKSIAFPRQIAMYLSRSLTDRSLCDIGDSFGGRDHGTVMHACRLIDARSKKDESLRQKLSYLQQSLMR